MDCYLEGAGESGFEHAEEGVVSFEECFDAVADVIEYPLDNIGVLSGHCCVECAWEDGLSVHTGALEHVHLVPKTAFEDSDMNDCCSCCRQHLPQVVNGSLFVGHFACQDHDVEFDVTH